jgi:hypothetical protein
MRATDEGEDGEAPDLEDDCCVTAHESSPDRFVFTEEGNTDGWIATDYTVDVTQ